MNLKHDSGWVCADCGDPSAPYSAKGLCKTCYARLLRRRRGMRPGLAGLYSECIRCGSKPVHGHGLCKRCYNKDLEIKNKDLRRVQKYRANKKYSFGGDYEGLLRSVGFECQSCGLTNEESLKRWKCGLDIHHKDGRGRTSSVPNHSRENLMVLCRKCHMAIHHPEGMEVSKGRRWAS